MDPFSSFDLFRRRVDQMFADFDQQMFGGADPFESPFSVPQPRGRQTIGDKSGAGTPPNPKEENERIIPHQQSSSQQPSQGQSTSLTTRPSSSNAVGLFGGWPSSSLLPSMKVDLVEEKERYLVHADVPGFTKDQLEVSVHDGLLTVNGKTSSSKEESDPDRKYHRVERSSGSIHRSIRLPDQVKEDEISATCENGVLKVVLPKDPSKEKRQKQIQVM